MADIDAAQVDKYRPRNVNEVASQQEVVATLKRALETANVRCHCIMPQLRSLHITAYMCTPTGRHN